MSSINWVSMTDDALLQVIGKFVRHHRLIQNITQAQLSKNASISRSTLSLLEKGEKITFATLIRVLRVLDLLHVMGIFQVKDEISPLDYMKLQTKKRQRARNSEDTNTKVEDLGW